MYNCIVLIYLYCILVKISTIAKCYRCHKETYHVFSGGFSNDLLCSERVNSHRKTTASKTSLHYKFFNRNTVVLTCGSRRGPMVLKKTTGYFIKHNFGIEQCRHMPQGQNSLCQVREYYYCFYTKKFLPYEKYIILCSEFLSSISFVKYWLQMSNGEDKNLKRLLYDGLIPLYLVQYYILYTPKKVFT